MWYGVVLFGVCVVCACVYVCVFLGGRGVIVDFCCCLFFISMSDYLDYLNYVLSL